MHDLPPALPRRTTPAAPTDDHEALAAMAQQFTALQTTAAGLKEEIDRLRTLCGLASGMAWLEVKAGGVSPDPRGRAASRLAAAKETEAMAAKLAKDIADLCQAVGWARDAALDRLARMGRADACTTERSAEGLTALRDVLRTSLVNTTARHLKHPQARAFVLGRFDRLFGDAALASLITSSARRRQPVVNAFADSLFCELSMALVLVGSVVESPAAVMAVVLENATEPRLH